MKTTTIVQEIEFNATPAVLYNMLMNEKKHAAFTDADASIENVVGGTFEVWNGYITGKNIEMIKNKKIVQEWHASDMPPGHISLLTIELIPTSSTSTLLKMTHSKVPANQADDFAKGWEDFYWKPMHLYLAK